MIRYELECRDSCGNQFESWFSGSADFDRLAAARLLACPSCGGSNVGKALMAPAVRRTAEDAPRRAGAGAAGEPGLRETLRAMRRAIEAGSENMGSRFAEEALKMHRGEAPERAIFGDATEEETRRLNDEGVPVSRIPWVPLNDA